MPKLKSLFKPSLNWLLLFVPIALVLRYWSHEGNEVALFVCSCLAIVPLADGWDALPRNWRNIWAMVSGDC